MKERIKKLRKTLNLTQQEFADRLGISRGNIATYETRDGSPGSSVISLICREFNVSESWLRTGSGDMFVPKEEDALDELVKKKNLSEADRLLIEKFLSLKADQRKAVMDYVISVADEYRQSDAKKREAAHAELDRQMDEEKEAAEKLQASQDFNSNGARLA